MLKRGDPKVIRAWTFYDWANSVYPLVISSAVFPIYYEAMTKYEIHGKTVDDVRVLGMHFKNTEFYAYVASLSYIVVALIAPLLSGVADYMGNKKRFLQFFCVLGASMSALLYFFNPQHLGYSMIPLFFASIGYWGSLVYYNAYLPEIAEPQEQDKVSARGFSMGYFGSSFLLILILVLMMVFKMEAKYAFPLVGLWWVGFALITFARLPGRTRQLKTKDKILLKGYRELLVVFKDILTRKQLRRFLGSYFMYNMGVQTVMIMATLFASKAVLWPNGPDGKVDESAERTGLIVSILLIQYVGMAGSFIFSRLSSLIGNLRALGIAIFIWILICAGVYFFVYVPWQFYIAAGAVGLVMGGIQSLSRSTYSKMLPETEDHASYFSFFDVSEKIGLAIGTASFGSIEGQTGFIRNSVLALISFFVVGFLLLLRVPKSENVK